MYSPGRYNEVLYVINGKTCCVSWQRYKIIVLYCVNESFILFSMFKKINTKI